MQAKETQLIFLLFCNWIHYQYLLDWWFLSCEERSYHTKAKTLSDVLSLFPQHSGFALAIIWNYKETHNDIQSLPPTNNDYLSFYEEESFSADNIIVANDGFEHFHECGPHE